MTQCQAEFEFTEQSGVLAAGSEIQYNALAYGYQHLAGYKQCTGTDLLVEIQPVKTTEITGMFIKVEDSEFKMPVRTNGTLNLGKCVVKAESDYFGNLLFKSTDTCKLYKSGDAKLEITDDTNTFEPINKMILLNESMYMTVQPYLILNLTFTDPVNATQIPSGIMVTVGAAQYPVIYMGLTNANGSYYARIPKTLVNETNNKYLISYSDL